MEWMRSLFGGRGSQPRQKGPSPEEFVEALQQWRREHEYAWWLNDNLDAVSRVVQQQLGLFRETRVAVAVRRKRDIPEADRLRLVEGCEKLLSVLEGVKDGPAAEELWPGLSHQRFSASVATLQERARETEAELASGMAGPAHEGYKEAVEDWLAFSVPVRYQLNAFMRESLPPEVVTSLPPRMLPVQPPEEMLRYVEDRRGQDGTHGAAGDR